MKDEEENKLIEDVPIFICLDDDGVGDNGEDLITSFKSSFKKTKESPPIITISDDEDYGGGGGGDGNLSSSNSNKRSRALWVDENPNPGPLAKPLVCELCTISKPKYKFLEIKGCYHLYCCSCVETYVCSKLDGGATSISCPAIDCKYGTLDPEYCKDFITKEVYQRWGKQLCESVIGAEQSFYCPFKECAVLLIDDWGGHLTMAECPYCCRLFCAQCRVPWHEGFSCEQYQSVRMGGRDRCPTCGDFVEKIDGCSAVSCRHCGGLVNGVNGAVQNVQSMSYPYNGDGSHRNTQTMLNAYPGGANLYNDGGSHSNKQTMLSAYPRGGNLYNNGGSSHCNRPTSTFPGGVNLYNDGPAMLSTYPGGVNPFNAGGSKPTMLSAYPAVVNPFNAGGFSHSSKPTMLSAYPGGANQYNDGQSHSHSTRETMLSGSPGGADLHDGRISSRNRLTTSIAKHGVKPICSAGSISRQKMLKAARKAMLESSHGDVTVSRRTMPKPSHGGVTVSRRTMPKPSHGGVTVSRRTLPKPS